jgi:hypothetical protein
MRLVTKVIAALVLVTGSGGIGLGASNCGFLTIEQCRATLTGGSSFACPINFTIRTGLPNAPVTDKRDERYMPTRCPTILIRGAPFIRTPGIKTRGNFIKTFHPQRVSLPEHLGF